MKMDFQRIVTMPDGEPTYKQGTKIPFTVKNAAIESLLTRFQDEQIKQEDSFNRYLLAMRIEKYGNDTKLTPEEVSLIKQLSFKNYGPLPYGHVCEAVIDTSSPQASQSNEANQAS